MKLTKKILAALAVGFILTAAAMTILPHHVQAQQADGCYWMIISECSKEATNGCDNGCTNYDQLYDACVSNAYKTWASNCPYYPTALRGTGKGRKVNPPKAGK